MDKYIPREQLKGSSYEETERSARKGKRKIRILSQRTKTSHFDSIKFRVERMRQCHGVHRHSTGT